jgi:hypothetical protein
MKIEMTLTDEEIHAFFTEQLGIPERTVTKLEDEGIESPSDLVEFDKEMLHQLAENLCKVPTRQADKNGQVVYVEPFVLSAKSYKRMQLQCVLTHV